MTWLRQHWFWSFFVGAALVLVMVGLDSQPEAVGDASAATAIVTRSVGGERSVADLPHENGQPVLPAWQDEPEELTFTAAAESMRLVEGLEKLSRPGAVQRLVIAKIRLDSDVAQVGIVNTDGELRYEIANQVVGQYSGVNPGAGGNVVLAGHVGTRNNVGGQVFRNLHKLELGDTMELYTDGGMLEYVVTEIRFVEPTATEVMASTNGEQLTLITCRSCNVDCQRLVVIAEPLRRTETA